MFIPFFGAYVEFKNTDPWRHSLVALAGPATGGLGRRWRSCSSARRQNSDLLRALAYFGFLLNLVNLIPIGILDGGAILRNTRWLYQRRQAQPGVRHRRRDDRRRAPPRLGMSPSHVPQNRL